MARPAHALIPASYVFLRRGDEVLLQLRHGTDYMNDHWAAGAAGHGERYETALETAVREAREELGIEIHSEDLVAITVMQRQLVGGPDKEQRVDWFFECRTWSGTPRIQEPDKCADLRWFALGDLPSPLVPHEALALEALAQGSHATVHFVSRTDPRHPSR
ncbi:NUDIX domain-containing protein [Demequina sp. NBRC 110054]|uniref:NUDIX hydrolase n=1 Tax=Demequina sp. NBRC 110054 TaxID=1570343 RepID=UPI0009FFEF85|nr:NUDIX domain-containing protein [Demequina sp. NBRC 110054]